jgi:hypothetical protein
MAKTKITINEEDVGKLVDLKMDLRAVESACKTSAMGGTLTVLGGPTLAIPANVMYFLLSSYRDKLKGDIATLISAP